MTQTVILVTGDTVVYHGTAKRVDGVFVMPGDRGTVLDGNEDYESDALVQFCDGPALICACELEWIS